MRSQEEIERPPFRNKGSLIAPSQLRTHQELGARPLTPYRVCRLSTQNRESSSTRKPKTRRSKDIGRKISDQTDRLRNRLLMNLGRLWAAKCALKSAAALWAVAAVSRQHFSR